MRARRGSIELTVAVWQNAQGELHLTCDDPDLEKGVNIQLRPNLESTRVLRAALEAALPRETP